MKIGLLGGSFNPAHEGHLYISLEAVKRLGLDQVWWLVSPQNPLKPLAGMAPFEKRLAGAKKMARSPKIRVLDIERKLRTVYTYDTLRRLKMRYPGHRFTLIIGADNLAQIPKWRRWRDIFRLVPIAVFDRDGLFPKVIAGKAASYFANYRKSNDLLSYKDTAPAWVFLRHGKKAISSTEIREK